MQTQLPLHSIGPVIYGYHENPFEVLGPHEIEQNGRRALAVRAYLPEAQRAWVIDPAHGVNRPMRQIHPAGLFEAVVEEHATTAIQRNRSSASTSLQSPAPSYQLRVTYKSGETHTMHDPYAFPPMMSELRSCTCSAKARIGRATTSSAPICGPSMASTGVNFAVWAPNAEGVAVVGDFNMWDRRSHAMRKHIPAAFGSYLFPASKPARITNSPSSIAAVMSSISAIRTASSPKCRRAPRTSLPT